MKRLGNALRKVEVSTNGVVFELTTKGRVDADNTLGFSSVTAFSVLGYSFEFTGRATYRLMEMLVATGRLVLGGHVLTVEDDHVKVVSLQLRHNDDVEATYDTLGEALEVLADKGVINNLKRPTEAVKGQ